MKAHPRNKHREDGGEMLVRVGGLDAVAAQPQLAAEQPDVDARAEHAAGALPEVPKAG